MAWHIQFRHLRRSAIALTLASVCAVPARAAKYSAPARVMMVATVPPTFSLQAAPATLTGAAGSVQVQSAGRARLLVRGRLRGEGDRVVVRIPVSLAANTRSFVVRAFTEGAIPHATIYLGGPEIMARPMPMRGSATLAMGMAKDRGHEFFAFDQPLHSTLEIIIENLPSGQINNFRIALTLRELGY